MNDKFTLLAIGDKIDYDSFLKLHREKNIFRNSCIRYMDLSYKDLLNNNIKRIKTKKILIFLFFPYCYWNRKIEPKSYKGTYGSLVFHKKFNNFWNKVNGAIKKIFFDKEVYFINTPYLSGKYRDKLLVKNILKKSGIPTPEFSKTADVNSVYQILDKNISLFLKVRYGSMGKGITFLSRDKWFTNFTYRNRKILSRKSDYGWRFKDVSNNENFLKELLKKNIYAERAIESVTVRDRKLDLRVYVFLGKIIHIYPRTNRIENITTNITQGGKGEYANILRFLPCNLIKKVSKTALKTSQALNLNFAGIDIIIDKNLRNIYVNDVNVFPGFPKVERFNLAKRLIKNIKKIDIERTNRFEKL